MINTCKINCKLHFRKRVSFIRLTRRKTLAEKLGAVVGFLKRHCISVPPKPPEQSLNTSEIF